MKLTQIQGLHESTKNHPKVYKGCLTVAQRQLMADIYADAKLREVNASAKRFDHLRRAWR